METHDPTIPIPKCGGRNTPTLGLTPMVWHNQLTHKKTEWLTYIDGPTDEQIGTQQETNNRTYTDSLTHTTQIYMYKRRMDDQTFQTPSLFALWECQYQAWLKEEGDANHLQYGKVSLNSKQPHRLNTQIHMRFVSQQISSDKSLRKDPTPGIINGCIRLLSVICWSPSVFLTPCQCLQCAWKNGQTDTQ